ncbi:ubiquitin-like-conjugating enzyme ATG10 [Xenentodon cancila]
MSSGVLDEEEFHRCCRLFLQRSEQLGDGWRWEAVQGSEEGYLRKTALRMVSTDWRQETEGSGSEPQPDPSYNSSATEPGQDQSASAGHADIRDVSNDLISDEDDATCSVTEGSSQVLQFEYHVLFSCSYSTPVLYFRASTLEGRNLTLKEVWSSTHPNFRRPLQQSPLNTISQQEHPILGQPFFFLHPCRTEKFMRPVMQVSLDQDRPVNYVVAWLSVVGPVVGLNIPLEFSA